MKNIGIFCIVAAALVGLLIVTKPSDTTCRREILRRYALIASIAERTGIDAVFISVKDVGIYKAIYNNVTGQEIGIGILSTVIIFEP